MAQLSGDAFVKALQSESVTLLVGPMAEPFAISKALLCHKSDNFVKLLNKPGLTELLLPGIGVAVTKMFVCWCYQERLQTLQPKATEAERIAWKELLIDLWLFADMHGIPKLQNQVVKQLLGLFTTPSLLDKKDVEYIFSRKITSGLLKDLATCTLVAQLEATSPSATGRKPMISDYNDLAGLDGFMVKMYNALHLWMTFEVPKKEKRSKWVLLLQSERVQKALMVAEVQRKKAASIPTAGRSTWQFAPGETIELD